LALWHFIRPLAVFQARDFLTSYQIKVFITVESHKVIRKVDSLLWV